MSLQATRRALSLTGHARSAFNAHLMRPPGALSSHINIYRRGIQYRIPSSSTNYNDARPKSRSIASSTAALPTALPPKSGILSNIPSSLGPYAELMRVEKPAGSIYFFVPAMWSTILASMMAVPGVPIADVLTACGLFAVATPFLRGATCTINDYFDRDFDRQVARTKNRPLARGAVSPNEALVFTGVQAAIAAALLSPFGTGALITLIPWAITSAIYPLMKRVTNYPQIMCGVVMSWGAYAGFPAMGLSLLDPTVALTAACLTGSNIAWALCYDTIYGHQDVADDKKAGVKSIALQHQNDKKLLAGMAVAQLGLLTCAGLLTGCSPVFFIGSCGGAALGVGYMIRKVNLKNVDECGQWFKWCSWAVGGVAIGGGLLLEKAYRNADSE